MFKKGESAFKPYPARPEQSIVFYPRQRELVEFPDDRKIIVRPKSMIMNQYNVRTNRHTLNDFLVIIVELQPGVLFQLTGLPLYNLVNTDIDADVLFPKEARSVGERLNSTEDYPEMLDIVERFLLQLTRGLAQAEDPVDKVAQFIIAQNYNASIDWLADQACLSARQFERKFKEHMGVGPKTFARLARMHDSYKLKVTSPHLDWLEVAIRCGYHDYQHLAKDYEAFSDCSPNQLLTQQRVAPESIFGMGETFSK